MKMAILEVQDVYVGYYTDIHILQGVSLKAREGQMTAVIGPNGVGKSTMLKAIYGFLTPAKGKIVYKGSDITGLNPYETPTMGISYILQRNNVFPYMTVEENLQLGAWTFRKDKERIKKRIEENYERFPILKERKKDRAGNFSGGQQRMVELGRALMSDPTVLLIDEPSAGLAPKVARNIYDKMVEMKEKEERTILLVDQNIRQAIKFSDYVYALELGKNLTQGPREEFDDLKQTIKDWL